MDDKQKKIDDCALEFVKTMGDKEMSFNDAHLVMVAMKDILEQVKQFTKIPICNRTLESE